MRAETKTAKQFHGWLRHALWIPLVAIPTFLVCAFIAATHYSGGQPLNHDTFDGYQFWGNPISDLGRYIAWNRDPNSTAREIYTPALIFLAISMIPIAFCIPLKLKGNSTLHLAGGFFLAISIVMMLGVAITPYDTHLIPHDLYFHYWLVAFAILLTTILIDQVISWWRNNKLNFSPTVATITLVALLLFLSAAIPRVFDNIAVSIATQKFVASSALIWLASVAVYMMRSFGKDISDRENVIQPWWSGLVVGTGFLIGGAVVYFGWKDTQIPILETYHLAANTEDIFASINLPTENSPSTSNYHFVGQVKGALNTGGQLIAELWILESGEPTLIYSSSEISGQRFIPYGEQHQLVAALPIVMVELKDFEQIAEDDFPDTPDVLELFHPPLEFKIKSRISFGNELLEARRYVLYSASGEGVHSVGNHLEDVNKTDDAEGLFVTVRRDD